MQFRYGFTLWCSLDVSNFVSSAISSNLTDNRGFSGCFFVVFFVSISQKVSTQKFNLALKPNSVCVIYVSSGL